MILRDGGFENNVEKEEILVVKMFSFSSNVFYFTIISAIINLSSTDTSYIQGQSKYLFNPFPNVRS